MKFRNYINEELKQKFWNQLIDKINRKYPGRPMMLRLLEDPRLGNMHTVLTINTFNDLPNDFQKFIKSLKLSDIEWMNSNQVVLLDDNWKKIYKEVSK